MKRADKTIITRRGVIAGLAASAGFSANAAGRLPRIVFFGDSLAAGFGLPEQQGMVPVLANWLARNNAPAQLVNAGLSGDTTYGGRVRIGWSLRRGADAVIVELGGNDMLLGWRVDQAEPNFNAILKKATASGRPVLLAGIQAPPGPKDWRRSWAEMWPRLARRHGTLLLQDLYAPIMNAPKDQRTALLQRDRLHASAAGVRLIVDQLGPVAKELVRKAGSS